MTHIIVKQGNIVEVEADAIVNAANVELLLGSGVAGAIRSAGGEAIQEACDTFPHAIEVGAAVATTAGFLIHDYVIHAASVPGPGRETTYATVAKATRSALACAEALRCESIVVPALGAGVGNLRIGEVARVIVREILAHRGQLELATLVGFDGEATYAFRRALAEQEGRA